MPHSLLPRRLAVIVLIVGIFFIAGGVGNSQAVRVEAQEGGPTPTAVIADQVETVPVGVAYRGERIFTERCTQCHGQGGKGDGAMAAQAPVNIADFTDPDFVTTRSPQDVFDIIRDGRIENLMPPWGQTLSEQEMWDAVAYIWSLHLASGDLDAANQLYESLMRQLSWG